MFNLYSGYIGIGEDKIMKSLSGEMTGRGIGSVLKSLVAILSLIYLSYLFQNKRKQFILLYLLYLISVVMAAAHRTPVVIAFIMPFLLWILHDRKGYVPKYFIAFSSVGVVFLMYIFNFYRQGMTQQLMEANITLKSAFMNSFSGLNTSKYFYELLNSDLKIEYFEKAYYWIITYIPRRLWEDKPIVSFNVRITEELFGYTVGDFKGADVATFTVPGEGFYQFGYVGVFLLTFAAVYMSRVLVAFYLRILYSELLLIGFMLSVLINFRSAFDSFLHSIIFSFLFTIVLIPFFFYVNKNVPVQNKYLRN